MQSLAIALALAAASQPVEPPATQSEATAPTQEPLVAVPDEGSAAAPATPPAPIVLADEEGPPEIVVEGDREPPPGDPLVRINAQTFEVVQEVDEALVEPIAGVYERALPPPIRKGLRNFFFNLREPIVAVNFLLQGKPGKAVETLGRFVINTTVGIGGLIDVAEREPFNLPYRRNGFANTLAIYGVGPGPFLIVPLVGPTTVRDLVGTLVDTATLPTAIGKPFTEPYYGIPAFTVHSLESRIELDERIDRIRDSDEPYTTARETYLRERQAEIDALRGIMPPVAPEPALEPLPTPAEAPAKPQALPQP